MIELAMEAFLSSGGADLILFLCALAALSLIYHAIFGQFFDV